MLVWAGLISSTSLVVCELSPGRTRNHLPEAATCSRISAASWQHQAQCVCLLAAEE